MKDFEVVDVRGMTSCGTAALRRPSLLRVLHPSVLPGHTHARPQHDRIEANDICILNCTLPHLLSRFELLRGVRGFAAATAP